MHLPRQVGVTATQKLASHDLDQTEMKISRVLHLANDAQAESKCPRGQTA